MGYLRNMVRNFTKHEFDIDDLVDFIAEETHMKRDTIEIILDTEEIYLRMKDIIVD